MTSVLLIRNPNLATLFECSDANPLVAGNYLQLSTSNIPDFENAMSANMGFLI